MTALQKVMSGARENAASVFRTGIGAAAAGVPVQEFSAISRALLKRGVPEEASQGFLGRLGQFQAGAGTEFYDPEYGRVLGKAVTGDATVKAVPEILKDIAAYLQTLTERQAIQYGGTIGMDQTTAVALRNAGRSGITSDIAAAYAGGVTPEQTKGAGDLISASAGLTNAWNHLSRIVYDELRPSVEKLYNILERIITFFGESSTARNVATYAIPGIGPMRAVRDLWNWATGAKPATGGTPGPQSALRGSGSGGDEASIRDVIKQAGEASGLNPAQIHRAQAGFLSAFAYESNLRHDVTRPGGSDTGWAQWVGTRLAHMRGYGDPHSLDANRKQLFYELTGPYKNYLLKAGRAGSDTEAAEAAHYFESGGAPQFEGAVKRGHMALANAFGTPFSLSSTQKPTKEAGASDDSANPLWDSWVKSLQNNPNKMTWPHYIREHTLNSSSAGSNSTINHGDVNVGDIHVHGVRSPEEAGAAVKGALRSSVTQAYTGLN